MISELSNGQSGIKKHGLHRDVRWSEPDSDEPGEVRAGRLPDDAPASDMIGVEDGAQRALIKDGAGGGPAEERT